MDPQKVEAIVNWEAPQSVKGVQSFIGFANFYRKFIKNFSSLVMPMVTLVQKNTHFKWSEDADQGFKKLKAMFVAAPILVQFDHTRTTVMETDSSGWCIGGTLLQLVDDVWRPCAYYSKKNAPAECNYEIYDKEMLAIVQCLEEWDAELRSMGSFQICTDHKNLEYFMTIQKLTEQQMHWFLILSCYNFSILYLPGKLNERVDTLSRREQDMPENVSNERVQYCMTQMIRPEMLSKPVQVAPVAVSEVPETPVIRSRDVFGETVDLEQMWVNAEVKDETYRELRKAVLKQQRSFPTVLGVRVFITECTLNDTGKLLFQGRRWVPDSKPLRTGLVQYTHNSTMAGHPGRDITSGLLS